MWGVPYFFIKVAVDDGVPPAFVAWSRVALGAAVLLPLAWRRGALRGLGGRWRAIAAYTACEVAVPFLLIALGEQHISSSLAAILIASMPLMVALLSVRFSPDDKPTGPRLAGLVVGFGGVVALLGVDVAGRPGELLGAVLVLVATLGYATAPMIVNRRLADLDPLGPIAASLALAMVVLAPAVVVAPPEGCRPRTRWDRWPCSGWSAPRSGWCCSSGWWSRPGRAGPRSSPTSTRWSRSCSASSCSTSGWGPCRSWGCWPSWAARGSRPEGAAGSAAGHPGP